MTISPGYLPPKPDAGSDDPKAIRQHTREIAQALGVAMQGGLNVVYSTFSCTSGTGTSVLTDVRLTQQGCAFFDPTTANAAAELGAGTLYIKTADRNKGAWSITHANAASGDRTFRVLIIG